MLREGVPIGVLALARSVNRIHRQTDRTGHDLRRPAVIAVENVRLFDQVQTRTKELTGRWNSNAATSEVLQIISGSRRA